MTITLEQMAAAYIENAKREYNAKVEELNKFREHIDECEQVLVGVQNENSEVEITREIIPMSDFTGLTK